MRDFLSNRNGLLIIMMKKTLVPGFKTTFKIQILHGHNIMKNIFEYEVASKENDDNKMVWFNFI